MVSPNTFVIGAMKAATSSLHVELARHPDVFMSAFKEPGYFLGPTSRSDPPSLSDTYRNDRDEYLRLFAGAGSKPIRGESTTDYTKRPRFEGVAARIHRFAPDARLIYLLRDPVERTISHYWWAVQNEGETRPMLPAIVEEPFYREVSHYAWQLEAYLEHFSPEQIFAETTERFSADPEGVMRRIFAWLGVRDDVALATVGARENVTPATVTQTRSRLLQRLRHGPAGDLLTRATPKPLRALGRRLAERHVRRDSSAIEEVKAFLRPIQRRETQQLSDLLGRRFDEWTTLHAGDA